MTEISVIVVNWNSKHDLARCLDSLRAQTLKPLETIVVDNGSSDGSAEMVKREYPEAQLLETGENLGFAEGMNRGIAASRGDWIAALNNDAIAETTWLEALARVARNGAPTVGMLQSRMVFLENPEELNSTGVEVFLDGRIRDRSFGESVSADPGSCEVFCASAGAALYRRKMLNEILLSTGYFDRTFFMYYEDVDLGWRARLAGWSCRYVADSVVRHRFHGSTSRNRELRLCRQLRTNRLRSLLKNASAFCLVAALPRIAWDASQLAMSEGANGIREWARALRDGARQRKAVTTRLRVRRSAVEGRWVRLSPKGARRAP